MAHFGEKLRRLRRSRGLTLPGLAIAAGITKGYLSKIEHAPNPPAFSTLQALAAGILNNAGPPFRYVFAACGMLPYHSNDPKII